MSGDAGRDDPSPVLLGAMIGVLVVVIVMLAMGCSHGVP